MEILCIGLSHHTAPVELREKFAIPDGDLAAAAVQLGKTPGLSEAVIVSTCNRVDFYVAAEHAVAGLDAVRDFVMPASPRPRATHSSATRRRTASAISSAS